VDLLSTVLRELRFESAAYRWIDVGSPFRLGFHRAGLRGVHIMARGSCELALDDGSSILLAEGDLVILPRGDGHVLRSPGADDRVRTVSSFDLAMRTPTAQLHAGGATPDTTVVCGAFIVGEADHPMLRGLPKVIHVPGSNERAREWLAPLVAAISVEAFEAGPGSDLVMARLSDALLVQALRHYADASDEPGWLGGLRNPALAPTIEAMREDLAAAWTVESLARLAGMSRAAFAARFADVVGVPAISYLTSLRMRRARELLANRELTVSAVARQVGYRSEVAFAAAFKRDCGTSPGAYRRGVAEPAPTH
jgi:AraC-like DNA-binding protein